MRLYTVPTNHDTSNRSEIKRQREEKTKSVKKRDRKLGVVILKLVMHDFMTCDQSKKKLKYDAIDSQ